MSYSDWHAGQAKKNEGGVQFLLCCVGHCLLVACQLDVICVHACLCFVVVHVGAYSVPGINIVVLQREPCFFKAELAKTRPQNRGHFSAQKSRTFLDTPYMGYRKTSSIFGPKYGLWFGAAPLYTGMLLCPFHLTAETFRIVCFIGFLSAFFLVEFWVYVPFFCSPYLYLCLVRCFRMEFFHGCGRDYLTTVAAAAMINNTPVVYSTLVSKSTLPGRISHTSEI